jgi:hypothetical protein
MNVNNCNFLQNRILEINTHLERFHVTLHVQEKDYTHSNGFIVRITQQDKKYLFNVIVKKRLVGSSGIQLINDQSCLSQERHILFAGEYITPKIEEYLLKNDISFINTSGNVFIHQNSLMLYFEYPVKANKIEITGAAFEPSGLKLVFHLLNKPESVSNSYRVLSDIIGISSGSISKILNDLKENDFIYTLKKKRILRNRNQLLDQWCVAYGRKLRPKYLVARYRTIDQPRKVTLPEGCYWSGEVAAEIMNKNIKSQDQIIYTEINPLQIVKKLHLIPDQKGSLELLHIFWNNDIESEQKNNIVPESLIYADLMLSGNDRNIEIAHELFK